MSRQISRVRKEASLKLETLEARRAEELKKIWTVRYRRVRVGRS
jgi:hypothetical protein